MEELNSLKEKLKKYNQEHLLGFYENLDNEEKKSFLSQMKSIDFGSLFTIKASEINTSNYENIEPYNDVIEPQQIDDNTKSHYSNLSRMSIQDGQLAICIMAGGQGSRLGHNGPKGTFMVDLGSGRECSIFELCISNIMKAKDKYGMLPYCFIMTSTLNHDDTVNFFEKHDYFGYDKSKIVFFTQGRMPLTDLDGNIVLEDKSHIYLAPNGNGGIFKALKDEKILDIMAEKKIRYLYITNVDNILTNPYDEIVYGNLIDTQAQLGVKTLIKKEASEKVGVCCKKDNRFAIVEYIDLPKELCEKKTEDGTLLFKDSYFGTCYLSLELLEKIANENLPFHRAKKKNEYIDKDGNIVLAKEINSIKSEMFIFDGFYKADSVKLYRVRREDEFAPIKGKEDIKEAVRLFNNSK